MKTTIFLYFYNKKIWLIAFIVFSAVLLKAQDIIIKNDKTEIKSKVTEITETAIKYKKWENMDGPVYSIAKSEVFMILYANGQRETITVTPSNVSLTQNNNNSKNNIQSTASTPPSSAINEDNSEQEIRLATTTNFNLVDFEYEWRYKLGVKKDFSLGLGGNITYADYMGLYFYISASQRFWLKPTNEFPLKIWASGGIANSYDWATQEAYGTGTFLWEFGVDVPLGKSGDFGLSFYTPEFNSLFLGIYLRF